MTKQIGQQRRPNVVPLLPLAVDLSDRSEIEAAIERLISLLDAQDGDADCEDDDPDEEYDDREPQHDAEEGGWIEQDDHQPDAMPMASPLGDSHPASRRLLELHRDRLRLARWMRTAA